MATPTVLMAVTSLDVPQVLPLSPFFLFSVKFSLTKLKNTIKHEMRKRSPVNLHSSILVSLPAANSTVTLTPVPTWAPAPPPAPGRCSRGQFMCRRPPHCIPDWQRCDGQPHCQDSSDETQCRESLLASLHSLHLSHAGTKWWKKVHVTV